MFRIGHSVDIHRLVENRKLMLGGIEIHYYVSVLSHIDAYVLLHAISEAIIGALALGDLGTFFPDNDPKYKGIDSKILLNEIVELMFNKGYEVNNVDCLLILEKPKMRPYIDSIKESVASLLKTDITNVNIKATTNEKMGEIGKEEAIQAHSVILLRKKSV